MVFSPFVAGSRSNEAATDDSIVAETSVEVNSLLDVFVRSQAGKAAHRRPAAGVVAHLATFRPILLVRASAFEF
jgi:hypothetical protein